ncbi:MAG: hypothetical protein AB7I27_08300 [Bacteriovoracaceae bacterium]
MIRLFLLILITVLSDLTFALDTSKEEMQVLSTAINETRKSIASVLASDANLEKSFKKYAHDANEILSRARRIDMKHFWPFVNLI